MTDNEILEILRDGCAPFVNLGLEKLGATGKLAAVRIARGELAVRIVVQFGAQLHATCQLMDQDGIAYEFSLDGLQRIQVDEKPN
jgi:hypothetical protein